MIKARVEEISRTKIKELGINPNQLSELKIIKNEAGDIDKLKASWPETLRALNEEGLSNILANPSLMTVDRKKAKLIIGDQIPVKLERIEDEQTVSTISYIEAGIVLEFLPKILNNNEVLLEIKPSVNSIGQILADGLPAVNSRSAEIFPNDKKNDSVKLDSEEKKQKEQLQKIKLPFKLLGIIKNENSASALFLYQGKNILKQEKDKIDIFKIEAIKKQEITISYQNETIKISLWKEEVNEN